MDSEGGIKKIIPVLILIVGVYIASKFILKTSFFEITIFTIIVVSFLAFVHWKKVLFAIPFWILIEGYIRRNFYDSVLILFIKDAALFVVYLRLFLEHLRGNRIMDFKSNKGNALIFLLFAWYCFGLVNPNLPSFAQGLVGIKVIFFYVPYFYLTKLLFKDKRQFFRYLFIFLLTSIPISIYAFYQYKIGEIRTDVHDIYYFDPETHEAILRPAASFYFASAFSQYSYIVFTLFLGLVNVRYFNRKRLLFSLIIAANIICILISGQRVVWVTIILQFCLFMILGFNISKKFSVIPKTIAVMSLIGILLLLAFPGVKHSASIRAETFKNLDNPGQSMHVRQDRAIARFIHDSPIFGHGPGTANPATRHLKNAETTPYAEQGHSQTIYEVGYVGWIIFLILLLKLASYARKSSQSIKDRELRMIGIYTTILPIGLIFIYFTTGALNVASTSILFWFSMGFIPLVRDLDEKENDNLQR